MSNLVEPITAIITRPYDDALDLKSTIEKSLDLACVIESMLVIAPVADSIISVKKNQTIICTSHNILQNKSFLLLDKKIKIIAVGKSTTDKLKETGFENVIFAGNDIDNLEEFIINNCNPKNENFIYLSGDKITKHIDKTLTNKGFNVKRKVVYTAMRTDKFADNFIEKIKGNSKKIILFYSTRTADNFLKLSEQYQLENIIKNIDAYCLSKKIASLYEMRKFKNVFIAHNPCTSSLLALISDNI